ncbi:MAG: hypothetical protein MJ233_04650 [Mycoplasmoidaceae bacterium]|nr:hypothetical protein [Mycoplasmoidaceae bacterium]
MKSINDDHEHLDQLADFIKNLKHCHKYELLSYHNLALDKYNKLGIDYPFKDIKTLTTQEFDEIKAYLSNHINK